MDTSKLITFGAVGIALWLAYEWMVSQCETPSSSLFGGSTCGLLIGSTPVIPASTTPVAPTTAAPTSTGSTALAALLTQAATAAGSNPAQLSADQWSYFYQGIPGKPAISGAQFESILTSMGLTDATRSSYVSATQFAAALAGQGLSGCSLPFVASWVPMGEIHGGLFG